jgi:hypothetical protein
VQAKGMGYSDASVTVYDNFELMEVVEEKQIDH